MKLFRLLLITSLSITAIGCIERVKTNKNSDAAYIENTPRVIKDTIIIRDTIVKGNVAEDPVVEMPKETVTSRPLSYSDRNDRRSEDDYDGSNSGFFDNYRNQYQGDPNAGISNTPTQKVVKTGNAEEIERKKASIEQSLNLLEQRNELEQQRYQELEKERQTFNEKAVQDAKEQQKKQQNQKQKATPRGKTLDTNILLHQE